MRPSRKSTQSPRPNHVSGFRPSGTNSPVSLRLPVRAPFHLEATVRVLQRRPSNLIDRWELHRYQRAIQIHARPMLIEITNLASVDAPDVRLAVLGGKLPPHEVTEAARLARTILGLDIEPGPLQRRAEAQPALRHTARALRGMRPPQYPDLFETVANVIPFQQLSVDAGMAVVAQIVRRFGVRLMYDGRPFHLFPSAETIVNVHTASLKRCGMSARKSESLRSVAKSLAAGALSADSLGAMSSSEALDLLTELPGIGPWSAALILLRGLGRLDVFPQADAGVEKSLAALLRLRSRASLSHIVARFGEQRGYLYFYGVASRLLAAGLIHPAVR